MNKKIFTVIIGVFSLALIAITLYGQVGSDNNEEIEVLAKTSAVKLKKTYKKWKVTYENNQGAEVLTLPLRFSKAYSNARTDASGQVTLHLITGQLNVNLQGLEIGQDYELWFVGGNKSLPDTTGHIKNIAAFTAVTQAQSKTLQLDRLALSDFYFDRMVLSRKGLGPYNDPVLVGSPSFFQRLYYSDKLWPVAGVGAPQQAEKDGLSFAFLLPKPAFASSMQQELEVILGAQIALGRDLFVNETFDGNGRTCATCHRLENNHTIDPKFIATLPDDDPLFVAEFDPNLNELDNPQLLRQLGMFLTNVDGFSEPDVFRGVPHTLALATSIESEDVDLPFAANAVGWSGDGAPGTGSLREFTEGAVKQHFPKTMARVDGVDFRLPTAEELDAMEAYMLSLGRQQDIDLASMTFSSPIIERGKELFDTKQNPIDDNGQPIFGQSGNCNGCHENAGANSSSTKKNPTRDTGAENQPDQPARLIDPTIAVDGGFGTLVRNDCGVTADQPCLGDARFNSASLIEAADTGPFFHNNSAGTIEQAVAFYTGDAFNNSPGSLTGSGKNRQIKLDASQVTAIALFLRTLNAMENIRSANELDYQVLQLSRKSGKEILRLSIEETRDAIQVLKEGQFIANPESLKLLKRAIKLQKKALKRGKGKRNKLLNQAIALRDEANEMFLANGS